MIIKNLIFFISINFTISYNFNFINVVCDNFDFYSISKELIKKEMLSLKNGWENMVVDWWKKINNINHTKMLLS